ncbi:MAG: type II secretion system major pseudopilin GspG [Phycisphaerae bacterium]
MYKRELRSHRRFHGRSARRAFTLIELLLVMVILAILAALVIPRFTGQAEKARKKAAASDIASISLALNNFEVNCGRFPTTSEGLAALIAQPGGVTGWEGPYLDPGKGIPKDPWGREYVYKQPGTHENDFDLYSTGPSGQDGGSDNIGNWVEK